MRASVLWTSIAVAACGIVGSLRTGDFPGSGDAWTLGVVAIGYSILGWLVSDRQPALPIGWLMLGGGAIQAWSFLATWWTMQGLVGDAGSWPLVGAAAWLAVWTAPLPWLLVLAGPLVLLPDGRPRSAAWGRFLVAAATIVGALVVATGVVALGVERPIELVSDRLVDRPRSTAGDWAITLRDAARRTGLVATGVALIGVVLARQRSEGLARRQFTTVLIGVAVVIANAVAAVALRSLSDQRLEVPETLGGLAVLAMATAIAVAVVRHQLFNVGVLVNRSALIVLVGLSLAGLYVVVLIGVDHVLDDSSELSAPSVVAAAVVVVATTPVASWATRATRGWFGRSGDVSAVATRVVLTTDVDDLDAVAARLATTVREELRLGSVEISLTGMEPAVAGRLGGPTTSTPLVYHDRRIGEIVVSARPGERLGDVDRRALAQIAQYVAVTAVAIRVSHDLRQAQEALRRAHDEERRRIRLDLHDGLGPTLAGIHLGLLAHRRQLADGSAIDDIVDHTADAIREVRRIVEGLQPSVLEDLGLVPALQILAADTRQLSGIDVTVSSECDLSDISPNLATTGYRVVAEGLANVIRHSGSRACTVRLRQLDRELSIDIEDDGCGFDPSKPHGMGLRSITSRAAAVGGHVTITTGPDEGTTLAVRLPS